MAGTLDFVQRGLTGLQSRADGLWFDPAPLPQLSRFRFALRHRGHWGLKVRVGARYLRVRVPASEVSPLLTHVDGATFEIGPGTSRRMKLPNR
ncbi:glycosyl hydrolase family 65 protein [Streptomyces sp. NPDC088732]|uniref:glycosyl hydrolase family 65 protein n=1 Tax=Streptomyces sp. NPDC088732 TaxID=3365879 RepID=UPI00382C1E6C